MCEMQVIQVKSGKCNDSDVDSYDDGIVDYNNYDKYSDDNEGNNNIQDDDGNINDSEDDDDDSADDDNHEITYTCNIQL